MLEDGDRITVSLRVNATMTAATWREWGVAGDRLVRRSTGVVPSSDSSVITCEECVAGTEDAVGLLIAASGSDYNLQGTVLLRAADVTLKGAGSTATAVTTAQIAESKGIKFNADHEAVVDSADGGFGRVIGGTLGAPRISFLSSLYTAGRTI